MSAIAKIETLPPANASAPVPLVHSESAALINMIERAARDPAVDVDKMERLFRMHGEVTARAAKVAFISALVEMQPKLPVITERGAIEVGGTVRSRYARWPDIDDAIKPVLYMHGFTLTHRIAQDDKGVSITGVLSHTQGHEESTTIRLPVDASGSKNAVQAIGSSTSYGQRYTAKLLLKITSRSAEDRDDDGRAAVAGMPITEEQVNDLNVLLTETKSNLVGFLKIAGVASLPEIPAANFGPLKRLLEQKKTAKQ